MQLGRTLAGAAIGAAIGLGLHLALGAVAQIDATWFAIITGALTGLGVRQAHKSLSGHVSYVRGAIAALIALIAIFASQYLVEVVMAKTSIKLDLSQKPRVEEPAPAPAETPAVVEPPEGEETAAVVEQSANEETAAETEAQEPADETAVGEVTTKPSTRPRTAATAPSAKGVELPKLNRWDFLFVAVGVLLAYELARGTSARTPAAPSPEAV